MLETRHDLVELRLSPAFEVKFEPARKAPAGVVEGYASAFGGPPDAYGDVIGKSAFDRTIAVHKSNSTSPAMLWTHNPARVIGRWTNMASDDHGLNVSGQLNLKTASGREAYEHLSAKDVTGLSIGYRVPPGGRVSNDDGSSTIKDLDLHEMSIVAMPACARARVAQVKQFGSRAEFEHHLHETGLPRAMAKSVSISAWPGLRADGECCGFCGATKDATTLIQGIGTACICADCVRAAKQLDNDNDPQLIAALKASTARWRT